MPQEFKLVSDFRPTGDQPQAIEDLTKGLRSGFRGCLGSGFRLSGGCLQDHWRDRELTRDARSDRRSEQADHSETEAIWHDASNAGSPDRQVKSI